VWVNTSPVTIMSTVSANGWVPNGVSTGLAATAGSPTAPPTTACTDTHAATGSSSTEGAAGNATPWAPKNPGIHSVRWRTTSRAVHPSQGDGLSQAPAGTPRTRSVNWPVMRS
jgi:hypothetical protein